MLQALNWIPSPLKLRNIFTHPQRSSTKAFRKSLFLKAILIWSSAIPPLAADLFTIPIIGISQNFLFIIILLRSRLTQYAKAALSRSLSRIFFSARMIVQRAHIADHAHFLGAIRLPNTAFKKNALTEVTTDIVFLQRTHEHETPERSWVEVDAIPDSDSGLDIPLNPYFIHRPEMMLGSMKRVDKMYESSLPALIAHPDQDLPEALAAAIANL